MYLTYDKLYINIIFFIYYTIASRMSVIIRLYNTYYYNMVTVSPPPKSAEQLDRTVNSLAPYPPRETRSTLYYLNVLL